MSLAASPIPSTTSTMADHAYPDAITAAAPALPAPPAPPATFRDVPWSWLDLLVGVAPIGVYIAGYNVALSLLASLQVRSEAAGWVFFGFELILMVWSFAYPLWRARRYGMRWRIPLRTLALESLIAIPLWFGVVFVVGIARLVYTLVFGIDESLVPSVAGANPRGLTWFLFLVAIYAPIAEELFFRGMIYNGLRRRMPWGVAAILQGAMFGVMHWYSVTYVGWATLLGILLAVAYEWRKTLITPIAIHVCQNLFTFVAVVVMAMNTPMLGVMGTPDGDATLTHVTPGSCADAAGLRAGDVVLAVDGKAVTTFRELRDTVRTLRVGDVVVIEFLRDGENKSVEVTLKNQISSE